MEGYGPKIKTEEDLANLFVKDNALIKDGSVIFIDEIHAIPPKLTEYLYTIMENFSLSLNGSSVSFPKFTLLAGTTEPQQMLKPLLDRFVNTFILEPYTNEDMYTLIQKNLPGIHMEEGVMDTLVVLGKRTPRLIKSLLKRVECFCYTRKTKQVLSENRGDLLDYLGYSNSGLTVLETKYLKILKDAPGKSVPLYIISNLIGLKEEFITSLIEPGLLAGGFVYTTYAGRHITQAGLDAVK